MALDTAIISGASEGIGAAFSKILIKHGWEVIGISRSEKKLNQLKKTIKINKKNFKPYVCNVKDFKKLMSIAKEENTPKLIYLNAGIYSPVDSSQSNIDTYKNFIKERLPRGIMGKTSEIIPLIKFLCSENSGMMSGCLIPIDGGESKSYSF